MSSLTDQERIAMRSQKEMLSIILKKAKEEEHVRAALLQGSRVSKEAKPDCFQDYDVVFIVDQMERFKKDPRWIDYFGRQIIMQVPEEPTDSRMVYLMQFTDGNRIDLTLVHKEAKETDPRVRGMVLLDKDQLFVTSPPKEEEFLVERPSLMEFDQCCNEFLWVSIYVAKGLWRDQILYAQAHLNGPVRSMMMKMLDWYIGVNTDFSVTTGKFGKYLQNYLDEKSWVKLLKTYPDAKRENIWEALFTMGEIFRTAGRAVARALGYQYPEAEDSKVSEYLHHIHRLPCDAAEIY